MFALAFWPGLRINYQTKPKSRLDLILGKARKSQQQVEFFQPLAVFLFFLLSSLFIPFGMKNHKKWPPVTDSVK